MTASSRGSIYDHNTSKKAVAAQRAWQKRPSGDEGAQRAAERERNEIYSHVSSRQHRDDQAAEKRGTAGDQVAKLRMAHRRQVVELAERHRTEGMNLNVKHQSARTGDPMMAAGKPPSPDLLDRERRETLALTRRHETERNKLTARQRRELAVAAAAQ
jgi:hypothetical protein